MRLIYPHFHIRKYYHYSKPIKGFQGFDVGYRFRFNGKENDNEVKGDGGQQDYGMRVYDTRLGRFLSVDPLSISFPWNSPYSFAENTNISCIDLDGKERYYATLNETELGYEITLTLSNDESVESQSAAGMAMVSWDGGFTFSNDFRFQDLQTVFCNSQFGGLGQQRLMASDGTTLVPYNANQSINNQSDGNLKDKGKIAPPVYSVSVLLPKDAPRTTINSGVTTGGFGGVDFGAPSGNSESIPYLAGTSASASITFNMGSTLNAQNEQWNVTITDNSGNILWSARNLNTGGVNQTVNLTNLQIGANALNIVVASATPETDKNYTGNYSYSVTITANSAKCP